MFPVRSDAGLECQESQPIVTNSPNKTMIELGADGMMDYKEEQETGWQPASTGVMV